MHLSAPAHATRDAAFSAPARIRTLDGIRGLAIAMVLLWHLLLGESRFPLGSFGAYAQRLGSLLWMGVDLFFVLSGFLITGLLLDSKCDTGYFKRFYIRRTFRILPAYLVLLFAYFLVSNWTAIAGASREWLIEGSPPLWSCLVFVQNHLMGHGEHGSGRFLSSTWSLAVEEQFYLVLPLTVRYLSGRRLWLVFLVAFLAGWAAKAFIFMSGGSAASVWLPLPCRLDAFMAGALGALLVRDSRQVKLRHWLRAQHFAITVGCVTAFLALSLMMPKIGLQGLALGGATLIAVIFGLLVASSATVVERKESPFLCQGGLVGLGTISYGVYLFHQPVNGVVHALIRNAPPSASDLAGLQVTLLGFAVTVGFCILSWRWFESPLVDLGRAITRQVKAPQLLPDSATLEEA